jgi:hypothetical protein
MATALASQDGTLRRITEPLKDAQWIDLLDPTPSAFIPLGIFKWRNWI